MNFINHRPFFHLCNRHTYVQESWKHLVFSVLSSETNPGMKWRCLLWGWHDDKRYILRHCLSICISPGQQRNDNVSGRRQGDIAAQFTISWGRQASTGGVVACERRRAITPPHSIFPTPPPFLAARRDGAVRRVSSASLFLAVDVS